VSVCFQGLGFKVSGLGMTQSVPVCVYAYSLCVFITRFRV
jgi:hypothetical protein